MRPAVLRGIITASIGLVTVAVWILIALVDAFSEPPNAAASPDGGAPESEGTQAPPLEDPLRAVGPAQPDSRVTQASPPDDAVEQDPTPEPAPMFSEEDEEAWRQSFAEASIEEIIAARDALLNDVDEKANPIMDSLHAAGRSEFLGPERKFGGDQGGGTIDNLDVVAVYMEPAGTFKVHLPPDQYPDIYALKARAMWLNALAHDRKHHKPLTTSDG